MSVDTFLSINLYLLKLLIWVGALTRPPSTGDCCLLSHTPQTDLLFPVRASDDRTYDAIMLRDWLQHARQNGLAHAVIPEQTITHIDLGLSMTPLVNLLCKRMRQLRRCRRRRRTDRRGDMAAQLPQRRGMACILPSACRKRCGQYNAYIDASRGVVRSTQLVLVALPSVR